jgi:hypothetical protein
MLPAAAGNDSIARSVQSIWNHLLRNWTAAELRRNPKLDA